MKLKIAFSNAWALGVIALAARLFTGMALDRPELYAAGWISALAGVLLCLPVIWICRIFSHERAPVEILEEAAGRVPVVFLEAVLLAVLLWDAAGV